MGLTTSVPFIIGGSDGCLANLGSGVVTTGELALTIGTSGAVRMTSAKPKHDPQQRIFNYILTEDLYVSGGPVNNGGNVIKWYVENFMKKTAARKKDFSSYVQEAADIAVGSNGLIFLPYLSWRRHPTFWSSILRCLCAPSRNWSTSRSQNPANLTTRPVGQAPPITSALSCSS